MIYLAVKKSKPKKFIKLSPDFIHRHVKHGEIPEVHNLLHNSWIKLNYGDYICIQDELDMYPVNKTYFEEYYEVVETQ